ncbi:MAG: LacI family DNA-binding transcriptional regulator [Bacteroidetes bacterium]|nr:LacI family DNA-binding transcriptional regulator [Bacteroidota bacterium]
MQKKKKTSKDIARELGISRSVVSFVLNGKSKEMRISDELTQKVLAYVEESNYQPNYMAQSLKTGRTHTIGLIVADIANPFFAKMAREVEQEVSKKGYSVIFCSSDENKKHFNFQLENLKNRQVDGLLLTPPISSTKILTSLISQKIPFVIIDRVFENLSANSVNINNHKAAFDATKRLINNNRVKVALINVNNELFTMNQRTKGYVDALTDCGMKVNPELIKQLKFSNVAEDVNKAIADVIKNNADAILFTTNKLGVTGMQAISNLKKRIPEDIAVISFDDTDAYAVAKTPITAIRQPLELMSKEAVRILIKLIENAEENVAPEQVVLDTNFIIRESCP